MKVITCSHVKMCFVKTGTHRCDFGLLLDPGSDGKSHNVRAPMTKKIN